MSNEDGSTCNKCFQRPIYCACDIAEITKERDDAKRMSIHPTWLWDRNAVLKAQGELDESVIRDAGVRLKHLRKALDGMIKHADKVMADKACNGYIRATCSLFKGMAQQALQGTPEGSEDMVLVPREPTEEMIEAGWRGRIGSIYGERQGAIAIYKAMISAAQTDTPEGGCEHGRDMTEYCLECGRVNGESEDG